MCMPGLRFSVHEQNPDLSVANRFYGMAENGEHKIRGVALRRGDTCAFIAGIQRQVIQILAQEMDPVRLAMFYRKYWRSCGSNLLR